jgi:hypothetical protein
VNTMRAQVYGAVRCSVRAVCLCFVILQLRKTAVHTCSLRFAPTMLTFMKPLCSDAYYDTLYLYYPQEPSSCGVQGASRLHHPVGQRGAVASAGYGGGRGILQRARCCAV